MRQTDVNRPTSQCHHAQLATSSLFSEWYHDVIDSSRSHFLGQTESLLSGPAHWGAVIGWFASEQGCTRKESDPSCHLVMWGEAAVEDVTFPWHAVINIWWVNLHKRWSAALPWNLWGLSWICFARRELFWQRPLPMRCKQDATSPTTCSSMHELFLCKCFGEAKKKKTMGEIELKFYFITWNGNYVQSFLFFSLFSGI